MALKNRLPSVLSLWSAFRLSLSAMPSPRTEPLAFARLIFFLNLWILTVAELTMARRLYTESGPFDIDSEGQIRAALQGGIESGRRRATAELIASGVLMTVLMPILVLAPLFTREPFIEELRWELTWVTIYTALFLGGAAALAPRTSSPVLPQSLRSNLAATLGLSFTISILLLLYLFASSAIAANRLGRGASSVLSTSVRNLTRPSTEATREFRAGKGRSVATFASQGTTESQRNAGPITIARGPDGRFNPSVDPYYWQSVDYGQQMPGVGAIPAPQQPRFSESIYSQRTVFPN